MEYTKRQNNQDIVIETFVGVKLNTMARVPIIAVYKFPRDYPDKFVARLWDIGNRFTKMVVVADTLEQVRKLIPRSMTLLQPSEYDDPVIVETYV